MLYLDRAIYALSDEKTRSKLSELFAFECGFLEKGEGERTRYDGEEEESAN